MKKITVFVMCIAYHFCGYPQNDQINLADSIANVSEADHNLKMYEGRKIDLYRVVPISESEIRKAFPKKMLGLDRKSLQFFRPSVGLNTFVAPVSCDALFMGRIHKTDSLRVIFVSVKDGAGQLGGDEVMYEKAYIHTKTKYPAKDASVKEASIKNAAINGYYAEVLQETEMGNRRQHCKIDFIVNDRYWVSLDGFGFTVEGLSQAIGKLDLAVLK